MDTNEQLKLQNHLRGYVLCDQAQGSLRDDEVLDKHLFVAERPTRDSMLGQLLPTGRVPLRCIDCPTRTDVSPRAYRDHFFRTAVRRRERAFKVAQAQSAIILRRSAAR